MEFTTSTEVKCVCKFLMMIMNIFLTLLKTGLEKNIELHAYYLMPNHFHLLVVPRSENNLSKFMQWVMISHVRYTKL